MFNIKLLSTCMLALVILLLSPAAGAQEDKWQLRLNGAWVEPSVSFDDPDIDGAAIDFDADSDLGFSLALERRISRRLGIEVGALYAESGFRYDVDVFEDLTFRTEANVDFNILTAGLNIHLTPGKSFDLYVGPLLAYTDFGDTEFRQVFQGQIFSADLRSSDNFAVGAQLGADIPLGNGPWGLNLAARYIDSSLGLSIDDGVETEFDFDPLILSAGFGFRF